MKKSIFPGHHHQLCVIARAERKYPAADSGKTEEEHFTDELKKIKKVRMEDFEQALKEVRPSISKDSAEFYQDFEKRYNQPYRVEENKSYFG